MQSSPGKTILIGFVALILLGGVFSGGVFVGYALPTRTGSVSLAPVTNPNGSSTDGQAPAIVLPAPGAIGNDVTPTNLQSLFKPFWEAWDLVHDEFVTQPVDNEALMQGAIRGMLSALGDTHTAYMDPQQMEQMNAPLKGEYDGIGAWVDITGDFLTITGPMADSPAEKAGLKSGDKVIAVDGADMTGIDGNLVLRKILGPAGTDVKLTIARDKEAKPLDFTITRAKITLKSVVGKMLDGNIAYVQLTTFGETTTDELHTALTNLMSQKPKGLILDLRNNGGGYLTTAISVVSQFIPAGKTVMYEQFGDNTRQTYKSQPGGLATDIPMVVLVNGGTASASEITAGAIQDLGRGKLIGEKTYGKGSVQNVSTLQNNEGSVRITIAHWLTPNERLIDKKGLEPDTVVTLTADDAKAGKDPQLDAAIKSFTP